MCTSRYPELEAYRAPPAESLAIPLPHTGGDLRTRPDVAAELARIATRVPAPAPPQQAASASAPSAIPYAVPIEQATHPNLAPPDQLAAAIAEELARVAGRVMPAIDHGSAQTTTRGAPAELDHHNVIDLPQEDR